jgi:peptide/nickel transport system substrate-binding protein
VERRRRRWILLASLCAVTLGCTNTGPAATSAGSGGVSAQNADQRLNRIVLAIKQEPALLAADIGPYGGGTVGGTDTILGLLQSGLAAKDPTEQLVPRLASALPTVENDLWKLLPNGAMETTWRIRSDARWHDGTPFTSDDLLFTLEVERDKDLPFANAAFDYIERAEAPDPRTITVRWNRTYLEADALFSSVRASAPSGLLPRHLLEAPFRADRASFMSLPYWNEAFVGTGPFRMREWARGSHYLLEANGAFILGRPRLDEVEVKFILDPSVIVANLLAGTVDAVIGGLTVPLDMALDMVDRWPDGHMVTQVSRTLVVFPQFINSSPAIIGTSAPFRRALLHALDRSTMGEAFQPGLMAEVAPSFLIPSELGYAEIAASVPRYDYDVRRAELMLGDLGYTKAAGGTFRSPAGEELRMEIRTTTNVDPRIMLAVADQWQRFGIPMDTVIIPPQRSSDREYRGTFPGFVFTANGMTQLAQLQRSRSAETPLPENSFTGGNTNRYRNPELDGLIDRVFTTISPQERIPLLVQTHRLLVDQVTFMPLWYPAEPGILLRNSVRNLERNPNGATWQAHLWAVTP